MSVIIVTPRTTEKAYELSTQGIYVFDVPLGVNRNQIKDAIEEQFEVTVVKVKTLVQAGKAIRFSRGKNRYPGTSSRKDSKKAYVTLKDGDSIQVFEESTKKETK
ncbi:MAG: 50S ribosomal protein L23 [bacterium]|nr:50S ribosomal protein L23 [bacterium]MDN5835186.1 50S ribosomal protein L23 [bacterium]